MANLKHSSSSTSARSEGSPIMLDIPATSKSEEKNQLMRKEKLIKKQKLGHLDFLFARVASKSYYPNSEIQTNIRFFIKCTGENIMSAVWEAIHLKTAMASLKEFYSTNCRKLLDFQNLWFQEYGLQIKQLALVLWKKKIINKRHGFPQTRCSWIGITVC